MALRHGLAFFVGLHQPSDAFRFQRCMVNVNRLKDRKSDVPINEWIMDSGAFQEISKFGDYRERPADYAARIRRWSRCGRLLAAVSQDWMCEPTILRKTGLEVREHQERTIARYDALLPLVGDTYLMPVLQGYDPAEYVACLRRYGDRLTNGQWVGVGSVCKRNVRVEEIEAVLMAVKKGRPDLRLHGFGVKLTSLASSVVRECLYSADSMAWSWAARKQGRDRNSWREAAKFARAIEGQRVEKRFHQWRLW